jgi:hypothetical protein
MKKIIMVGLLVLLAGCHTTPTKSEQKIEDSEDATYILSDIIQFFKW